MVLPKKGGTIVPYKVIMQGFYKVSLIEYTKYVPSIMYMTKVII